MGENRHAGERYGAAVITAAATAARDRAAGALRALVRRRGGVGGARDAPRDRPRRRPHAGRPAFAAAGTSSCTWRCPPPRRRFRSSRRTRPGVAAAPSCGTFRRVAGCQAPGARRTRRSGAAAAAAAARGAVRADERVLRPGPATGAGAAWNARATFPGASALKLAVAVTALARTEGTPTLRLDARPPPAADAHVLGQRRGERHRAVLRRLDLGWLRRS